MIRKIILKNFMSHRSSVIELADGLTVLAGENNCGKSAVVAALQILCYNATGGYMVRHGEKECSVTVETGDGHVVEWKRIGSTVSYCLDGESVNRVGRGVPDNLHALLRLPQVGGQDGTDPFDIHFAEQKKPIFLLDQAGSRAARFFASSSDAEALLRMQSLHREKVRDAGTQRDRLTQEIRELNARITPLEAIDDIQLRLDALDQAYARIVSVRSQWEKLSRRVEEIRMCGEQTFALAVQARVVSQLRPPPTIRNTQPLMELTVSLADWQIRLRDSAKSVAVMGCLVGPPVLADIASLERITIDIARVSITARCSALQKSTLLTLKNIPTLLPTAGLENTCKEIEVRLRRSELEQMRVECSRTLSTPPPMADTNRLQTHIQQMLDAGNAAALNGGMAGILARSQPPPVLQDEAALTETISALQRVLLTHGARARRAGALFDFTAPPAPSNTQPLGQLIADIQAAQRGLQAAESALRAARGSVDRAEEDLRMWVEANPTCPTCGAQLDPERLMSCPLPQAESEANGHMH